MRKAVYLFLSVLSILACKTKKQGVVDRTLEPGVNEKGSLAIIAFGSCNKTDEANVFWDDILAAKPDVFVWGGDNIYADTDDMSKMAEMYAEQNAVAAYATLKNSVFITGTWDDHDYGVNDGGVEFPKKRESQQLFLDFMDVPSDDVRRNREGVYSSQMISKPGGRVKIINLDTRYFRSPLTVGRKKGVRYEPNAYGDGTILGEQQWNWLQDELSNSKADFNLIVSSVQFLSNEHGFEKWANHPHEVDRMIEVIKTSRAKGVILLSGDRHISEFSKIQVDNLAYPIIDFTSSGMTHSYSSYSGEPNPYRIGEVVSTTSFGILEINLVTKEVHFKIMGEDGMVYQELKQSY